MEKHVFLRVNEEIHDLFSLGTCVSVVRLEDFKELLENSNCLYRISETQIELPHTTIEIFEI